MLPRDGGLFRGGEGVGTGMDFVVQLASHCLVKGYRIARGRIICPP